MVVKHWGDVIWINGISNGMGYGVPWGQTKNDEMVKRLQWQDMWAQHSPSRTWIQCRLHRALYTHEIEDYMYSYKLEVSDAYVLKNAQYRWLRLKASKLPPLFRGSIRAVQPNLWKYRDYGLQSDRAVKKNVQVTQDRQLQGIQYTITSPYSGS